MNLRHFFRDLVPHVIVERRRTRVRLQRLGLHPRASESQQYDTAANACRYDLWPQSLRDSRDCTLVDVGANEGDFIRRLVAGEPAAVVALNRCRLVSDPLSRSSRSISGGRLVAPSSAQHRERWNSTAPATRR